MQKNRIALVMACLATALGFVIVPAHPAGASEMCTSYSKTPFMIDPKIWGLDGETDANCQQRVPVLTVESTLELWSSKTNSWHHVNTGDRQDKDVQYLFADGWATCDGLGDSTWRTTGESTGLYGNLPVYYSSHSSSTSSWKTFQCTDYIQAISDH